MLQKKWFVLIGVFIFLSLSISISVGRTIEKKAYIRREETTQRLETVREERINKFLSSFFTFKRNGENYPDYESFMTEQAKEKEKVKLQQREDSPAFFDNSVFLDSKNYIRKVSDQSAEVISEIRRKIDLINQEGVIVTSQFEHTIVLKLVYLYDASTDAFLIDHYDYLEQSKTGSSIAKAGSMKKDVL